MHRQYTTHIKQDAIITIRWYLATCFGRDRPSSGQLRTTIKVWDNGIPLSTIFTVPQLLFLVGLKMAGHGRNM